jgi:hypothetical protein
MKATIKYEVGGTKATIRTADGSIATCHHNGKHILTEYYQNRSQEKESAFGTFAQGKMYIKDWKTKQAIDREILMDALNCLVMPQPEFKLNK